MKVVEEIGEPALLELIAEESAELAHAALKLARIERGENPTPKHPEIAKAEFMEELGDLVLILCELKHVSWVDDDIVGTWMENKKKRMETRIMEAKHGKTTDKCET